MPTSMTVALGDRSYPIEIGEKNLAQVADALKTMGIKGKIGLLTDSNVGPLYADRVLTILDAVGFEVAVHTMPAGEAEKRMSAMESICGTFLEGGLDRASAVVAVGGGVVGDIAGFVASIFMRGIPFVQIPTTIVAQVDSSVGGKTGVNHPLGKNTIGAFHQPGAVIMDMTLLDTLPLRELSAGMAEVIKHGVIADAELFDYLENNAEVILAKDLAALEVPIVRSCEIKSYVVSQDEQEHGLRAILNYGHTFGHAIESTTGYTRFLHGEAVSLGMIAAGVMAQSLGMVDAAFVRRQAACCAAYGLPVRFDEIDPEACVVAMKKDKKARAGTLKFILPEDIGTVVQRTDITDDQALAAFQALRES